MGEHRSFIKLLLTAATAAAATVVSVGTLVFLTEQYPAMKLWVLVFMVLVVVYLPIFDHLEDK